jgi:hypothetical protein
MSQVARNLSDPAEGFLIGKPYLIHDRDPLFAEEFSKIIQTSGIKSVKLPPRMILFGEGSLRKAIHEFIEHYPSREKSPSLGNRLIVEEEPRADKTGAIQCRQRLGGMLNYYYCQAA